MVIAGLGGNIRTARQQTAPRTTAGIALATTPLDMYPRIFSLKKPARTSTVAAPSSARATDPTTVVRGRLATRDQPSIASSASPGTEFRAMTRR